MRISNTIHSVILTTGIPCTGRLPCSYIPTNLMVFLIQKCHFLFPTKQEILSAEDHCTILESSLKLLSIYFMPTYYFTFVHKLHSNYLMFLDMNHLMLMESLEDPQHSPRQISEAHVIIKCMLDNMMYN